MHARFAEKQKRSSDSKCETLVEYHRLPFNLNLMVLNIYMSPHLSEYLQDESYCTKRKQQRKTRKLIDFESLMHNIDVYWSQVIFYHLRIRDIFHIDYSQCNYIICSIF